MLCDFVAIMIQVKEACWGLGEVKNDEQLGYAQQQNMPHVSVQKETMKMNVYYSNNKYLCTNHAVVIRCIA